MAVTEGVLPVGSTGEELDTTVVEQTDGTLAHREAVILADPENNDARASLEAFSFATETRYTVPVSGPELRNLCELMTTLIQEVRLSNLYNSFLAGEELTVNDMDDPEDL